MATNNTIICKSTIKEVKSIKTLGVKNLENMRPCDPDDKYFTVQWWSKQPTKKDVSKSESFILAITASVQENAGRSGWKEDEAAQAAELERMLNEIEYPSGLRETGYCLYQFERQAIRLFLKGTTAQMTKALDTYEGLDAFAGLVEQRHEKAEARKAEQAEKKQEETATRAKAVTKAVRKGAKAAPARKAETKAAPAKKTEPEQKPEPKVAPAKKNQEASVEKLRILAAANKADMLATDGEPVRADATVIFEAFEEFIFSLPGELLNQYSDRFQMLLAERLANTAVLDSKGDVKEEKKEEEKAPAKKAPAKKAPAKKAAPAKKTGK